MMLAVAIAVMGMIAGFAASQLVAELAPAR